MSAEISVEQSPADLIAALPTFEDLAIEEWYDLKPRLSRAPGVGQIATAVVTMNDGSRYIKRDISPLEKRNNVRIEMMTALGTRVKGFNTGYGELVSGVAGSEVSIIGSNQACEAPTTLTQDAWAANLIMVAADAELGQKPGEQLVVSSGKSRGGMGGNGKLAYAPHFGRKIDMAVHEDPCLLHPTSLKETAGGLTILDIVKEGSELGQDIAAKRPGESRFEHLRRLWGMAPTIVPSKKYLEAQIHSGKALWRGDAGIFLTHMPAHQALVTLMMNGNRLNHRHEYGQHQLHLPHSHIVDRPYKHLALVRNDVVLAGADALATSTRLLAAGEHPTNIAQVVAHELELRLPPR